MISNGNTANKTIIIMYNHHFIVNGVVFANGLKNGEYIYINNPTVIPKLTIKDTLSLKLFKKFIIVNLLFFN